MISAFGVLGLGALTIGSDTVSAQSNCGGVPTAIITCDGPPEGESAGTDNIEQSGIWGILLLAINVMVGAIGVAALGGIIYGAILYTSAGGSAEQTKKAMTIIGNVVIGVVAFAIMYALLNFLIPGGVLN